MTKLGLYYRVIVTGPDGRVRRRSRWLKSRSYVKQFLQLLEGNMRAANISGVVDTGGTSRTIYNDASSLFIIAADNVSTYGVVVGTGTTAPTNTDTKLETQIAHGTGSGQLDYGTHSVTTTSVVGSNVDFVVSRAFYNASGATITVREIGVYMQGYDGAIRYFCIIRDVLASAVAVANTETLTVQYTLRTTV